MMNEMFGRATKRVPKVEWVLAHVTRSDCPG